MKDPPTTPMTPSSPRLTVQEAVEAEHSDPLLPLHGVGRGLLGHARAGPEHLALAEAHGIDVLALDLQDEAAVHHIQQLVGVEALLVVRDLLRAGEQDLLQADRAEQVHLVRRGLQVAVVQPAALRVADGQGAGPSAPVLELDV